MHTKLFNRHLFVPLETIDNFSSSPTTEKDRDTGNCLLYLPELSVLETGLN